MSAGGCTDRGVIGEVTNLDAQAMSIEVPSVPGCLDESPGRGGIRGAGNVHVVVGVLGIASASEFDKGVTGSRVVR